MPVLAFLAAVADAFEGEEGFPLLYEFLVGPLPDRFGRRLAEPGDEPVHVRSGEKISLPGCFHDRFQR